jgi:cell division protein FtsQ
MKSWVKIALWSTFGLTVIVLLMMVRSAQDEFTIDKPEIIIHINGENAFLTKDELYTRLRRKGLIYNGQTKEQLKVSKIETYLRSMTEVKDAKVFSKIGGNWTVEVDIRKPIARIFNKFGETFYLDDLGYTMAPSTIHTARVVVVTGNISDKITSPPVEKIINNPSWKSIRKIDDVYRISSYVCNDPLLRSLIGQIHRKMNGDFVLIPEVGGQKIIFGTAYSNEEVREKFRKLKIFYTEAIPYEGWNKYEEISLKYDKQIVCKKKS